MESGVAEGLAQCLEDWVGRGFQDPVVKRLVSPLES